MELQVDQVTIAFGARTVLQDASLQLRRGEIVGLFGRNGSGKSTLLKIIFGTVRAPAAQLRIDGERWAQRELIPAGKVAYLPQQEYLPTGITTRALLPLLFSDGEKLDRIFYAPLVEHFAHRKLHDLSVGERKYLGILILCQLDHPFLLLDEPFTMIDPLCKDLIKTLLAESKKVKGILLSDHYYDDVLQIADRSYLLQDGGLVPVAGRADLKRLGYLGR
ncbi:ATP-binding cassette domain-containing protein [Neolewinella lacunae]|uniref:ATP-binding cassette domain-containing protein n=1 Tax=Neolewinella lacunae TaxID=1517758 RepID=A0A923T7C5_9BACT|nr:ATP-binding cassette domain-containing protein [Neolewinella lacunae]MBC6993431.1 ATP-binding cassette domain-containing protein [Neolewinella lacunae]MDN3636293.1 ATP-binding cassette domain-containing protein [Neolewinella lacunae]